MKLSGKKLTTAILACLMGATMFGGSVFAAVTDQEFNEVRQGVNANSQRLDQLESAQQQAKDYSKDIAANTTAIAKEATARTKADTELDKRITNVKEYLENQTAANYVSKTDATVQDAGVVKADKKIGENVTALGKGLYDETAARIGADAAQDKVIKGVNDNLVSSVNTINKNIGTITDQLNKNDLAEAQARDAADQTLQKNIDAEATARDAADQKLQGNIDAETTARQTDVANLQKNITDSLIAQGKINETLTTTATNLENHLSDTDGRVDKANAEIHTNAGNIAQNKKDIADIQKTLNDASVLASADATNAAKKAANDATTAADNANKVADGLKDRVDLISNNQNVTSESDLIKKDQSVGQNLTNVDKALHKEISDRQAADDKLKGDMKKNLGIIQGQQDEQDNKIADHENRITANAGKIKNNQDAIKANSDKLTNHEDRITTNESNIEANANTLHKVQGDVVDNKNAISAEAAARGDKDKEHDTAIAANKKAIGDEAAARQADISRLDNKIHDVSKEVDTVGALSMAMSGLHPLSYDEGDARFQLSAAVGTYDGTEALALGGFYHFNRDSMLSVGVATDLGADEHRMGANVGYTRRIGQGGHVSRPSEGTVSDIMKDIKNLEQKQAKLEQENEQLKQQLAALKK